MSLTRLYDTMTYQRLSNSHPRRWPTHLASVILLASASSIAYAVESEETFYLRQEPITPIPLSLEPDKAKAALGETLFFDTRLSRDNRFACASCHQLDAGGDDNVPLGKSSSAETNTINTPTVFNAIFNFRQDWDGALNTMSDSIEHTMFSHHEFNNSWDQVIKTLSADTVLVQSFKKAYADDITQQNIVDALVEFQKTLITPNSRFDQYLRDNDDALTEEELAGYHLFKEQGCISCHQGVNIGGNLFQKFGVFYDYLGERGNITKADLGRYNVTNRYTDEFVFKVPSLRNIAGTAPYLHDGSAATLDEVILIMGKTQLGKTLKDKDVQLIKKFLLTLTGEYNGKPVDNDKGDGS